MATLEKRSGGGYRVIFRYAGRRYSRSLGTASKRAALLAVTRLEDNLHRVKLGTIDIPNDAEIATFLLSDGRKVTRTSSTLIMRLDELCDAYLASIPHDAIEGPTFKMLEIHFRHLKRILRSSIQVNALRLGDLQSYVDKRAKERGRRGTVSPITIKKEIRTLASAWKWGKKSKLLTEDIPSDGLRYPKVQQKPPFQTYDQIARRIERGGLNKTRISELWDSMFLTLDDIREFLLHAEKQARHSFIFPMMACAAHTGARRSELMRCEIDDIDFISKSLTLREKKRVRGECSMRTVPLSPYLEKVLAEWLKPTQAATTPFASTHPTIRNSVQNKHTAASK